MINLVHGHKFVVMPDLPDYSVPTEIRIFVVGALIEDGKQAGQVASYIDLRQGATQTHTVGRTKELCHAEII